MPEAEALKTMLVDFPAMIFVKIFAGLVLLQILLGLLGRVSWVPQGPIFLLRVLSILGLLFVVPLMGGQMYLLEAWNPVEWPSTQKATYDQKVLSALVAKEKQVAEEQAGSLVFVVVLSPENSSPAVSKKNGESLLGTFDIENDGFAEFIEWPAPPAYTLVIPSGRGQTPRTIWGYTPEKGMATLKELDNNLDGIIDAKDAAWSSLYVWQTHQVSLAYWPNGAGAAQSVFSRIELGNSPDTAGRGVATNGVTYTFKLMGLKRNLARADNLRPVRVGREVKRMPYLAGRGRLADLHQAMARDSELLSMVQQYVEVKREAFTAEERVKHADSILMRWAEVAEDLKDNERGGLFSARKLQVLEKAAGKPYIGADGANPTRVAIGGLNQRYKELRDQLMAVLDAHK